MLASQLNNETEPPASLIQRLSGMALRLGSLEDRVCPLRLDLP